MVFHWQRYVIVSTLCNQSSFLDGNEVQIHNASRSFSLSDRTVVSNLTLTNLTIDQEGSYRCKGINNVTNLIGSEEDTSIHLTVQGTIGSVVIKLSLIALFCLLHLPNTFLRKVFYLLSLQQIPCKHLLL